MILPWIIILVVVVLLILLWWYIHPSTAEVSSREPYRHFIWCKGFHPIVDKGLPYYHTIHGNPTFHSKYYQGITHGASICVRTNDLRAFLKTVFTPLKVGIILVTTDADETIPDDFWADVNEFQMFLQDPRLIHWFVTNMNTHVRCQLAPDASAKLTAIPLGVDYHTLYERSPHVLPSIQEDYLAALVQKCRPFENRLPRAYGNFHFNLVSTRYEDRAHVYQILKENPAVYFVSKRTTQFAFWDELGDYAFVISPHGLGLDCHRTWEALILGCMVIVKSSCLDELYEGLPVIIVSDWSEITSDNLKRWQHWGASQTWQWEKLTLAYWQKRITSV